MGKKIELATRRHYRPGTLGLVECILKLLCSTIYVAGKTQPGIHVVDLA